MIPLSPHEIQGSTWLKLKEGIEEKIDQLRKRNDGDFDLVETTRLRGQIMALKNLLAVGEPPRPTLVEDDAA